MSGHCVEKIGHAKCGSSDALQVFEEDGKYTGFCFSCNTYISDPYNGNPPANKVPRLVKTQQEIEEEMAEVASLPTLDLDDRHLYKWALEYFGVKIGVSEEDGITPVITYSPQYIDNKLDSYKARIIETKQFFRIGNLGNDVDLFGWKQAINSGASKLFITTGYEDAVALFQALKQRSKGTQWEELNPAVVSLVNGDRTARKDIIRHLQVIRSLFKEVILAFDMDESGQRAVQDVMQILPQARAATLPEKDANECVIKGKAKALADAVLWRSSVPKNTRLVNAKTLFTEARRQAEWGYSWPWPSLTDATRGIRLGETYYIGAGVKMGKTELRNSIADHLMHEHNMKIFMAALEEVNNKTIKLVLGKRAKTFFHDPKKPFDPVAYDKAAAEIGDKLFLLDLYQHADWKTLRNDMVMAAEMGCQAAFIDPITNVVNGLSASETDTVLKEMAPDMSALARELQMALFIFCHLKSPDGGPPHERGGKVFSSQFAGSRAMMRSCNYMMGLEGNKDPDLPPEQRNLRHLILLEDREFGEVADIPLYWDVNTGLFNEV